MLFVLSIPQLIRREGKTIMPDERTILLDRQRRVFRIACDPLRYSLTLGIIAADSGLGYDSVRHYASGETALPLAAFNALVGVLPDELLSLLLPEGRKIVRVPENVDHDAIGAWAEAYAAKKLAAHRADSECQERIGPNERADLDATVVQFPGVAA
jgi:hypothetical protein